MCSHSAVDSVSGINFGDIPICFDCCSTLYEAGTVDDDSIPSVTRLYFGLAYCASYRDVSGLRRFHVR